MKKRGLLRSPTQGNCSPQRRLWRWPVPPALLQMYLQASFTPQPLSRPGRGPGTPHTLWSMQLLPAESCRGGGNIFPPVGLGHLRVLQEVLQTRGQPALPPDPLRDMLLLFPPAPASHHRPVRAFRCRGSCQLHQHPADEAEVSPGVGRACLRLHRHWWGMQGLPCWPLAWRGLA